jgi:hypothetical protein
MMRGPPYLPDYVTLICRYCGSAAKQRVDGEWCYTCPWVQHNVVVGAWRWFQCQSQKCAKSMMLAVRSEMKDRYGNDIVTDD